MKKLLIVLLSITLIVSSAILIGCNSQTEAVTFTQEEYEIHDGDVVSVKKGKASYELVTVVDGVTLDSENGKFYISDTVPDCTQVIVVARIKGKIVASVICRLRTQTTAPTVEFTNLSQYLVNGDTVNASSAPLYAVSYSLKEDYDGISINSVTGKVTFGDKVSDGTSFTVVAKAKEETAEKTFFVAKSNYVLVDKDSQITEYKVGSGVKFTLSYQDNPFAEQAGVLAVMRGHKILDKSDWSYNANDKTLSISENFVSRLSMGDNVLKIITAKNALTVSIKAATYVATARELAAINDSREALSGYYIMVCDIDLSEYLGINGDGYDNGRGWRPIGTYFDVTDGTATDWAFNGTFDGNGHVISGFFMDRSDDYAYNAGLFGYITAQGRVKNLGLRNAEGRSNKVRSYSGGFVGVNVGEISDCWADVDVITGEIFKVVGGFVGRNEGVITNCYSLGKVSGGSDVGCFAGVSHTDISSGTAVNCYAVKTDNYPFSDVFDEKTCKVVASAKEMANCDFSSYAEAWTVIAGELPVLKSISLEYELRELNVSAEKSFVTRGETLQLKVVTNPVSQELTDAVTYKVLEGKGIRVGADGLVNTSQVQRPSDSGPIHCAIQVSCFGLSVVFEFDVYDKISEVTFDGDMERTLYAGYSYKIDAAVKPLTANPELSFRLSKTHNGVTLDGDIINVSNYVSDGSITIVAIAKDGTSAYLDIAVVGNKSFDDNYKIIYRDDGSKFVEFALPAGVASDVFKVTMFDKSIPYTVSGGSVVIDKNVLSAFEDREVPLKFITRSEVFMATAVAYDSEKNVIKIGSIADFMSYKADFMDDMRPANERKFTDAQLSEFRAKTVCLTADLDFENATITSIGSHHMGADFSGVFNGNGFTIRNLNIDRNEFSGAYVGEGGVEHPDESLYPFHASRYNVGLFSFVKGSVANVNFDNVTVASRFTGEYERNGQIIKYTNEPFGNSVGVVAGTVSGTVSNCTFTNCKVYAGGELKGIVCGKQDAVVITNCHINGELYEK